MGVEGEWFCGRDHVYSRGVKVGGVLRRYACQSVQAIHAMPWPCLIVVYTRLGPVPISDATSVTLNFFIYWNFFIGRRKATPHPGKWLATVAAAAPAMAATNIPRFRFG